MIMRESHIFLAITVALSAFVAGCFSEAHAAWPKSKSKEPDQASVSMPAAQEFYKKYDGRVAAEATEFQKTLAPIAKHIEELNKPIADACKGQKDNLSPNCKKLLKEQAAQQIKLFKIMEEFYGKARYAMEEKKKALSKSEKSSMAKRDVRSKKKKKHFPSKRAGSRDFKNVDKEQN